VSLKRFHGWEPVERWERDGDGWRVTREPEWDADERDIMRARRDVEADRCQSCGGWLTETLTDKEPLEDSPDHYYGVEPLWCRKCVAHDQWRDLHRDDDQKSAGTLADKRVHARRLYSIRKPLPAKEV